MHLWLSLPAKIESGLVRISQQSNEIETTDGGYEVRNARWNSALRSWQPSYPIADADDVDHTAVEQMWEDTNYGVDTFNFTDPKRGDTTRVRVDGALQFTNNVGSLYHLDTFTLKEVRDVSPEPTAGPAITGTLTVGSTLTVSNGTWSGGATSYSYQWLRDGVAVSGATASTYVLVSGDSGKMIGCAVTATDANGGSTKTFADEVGPIA
jgi:hypothetical protein